MVDLWTWMIELIQTHGYAGAFLVSILGNISIFIPVPFALVIYAFGSILNPLALGIVAGIGSTIGELSAYLIGVGGRKIIQERYGQKLDAIREIIRKYGVVAIFLSALLPIPDDLILIPLGMMRYDIKKTFLAMLTGKTIMCIFLAYAGFYSLSIVKQIGEDTGLTGIVASAIVLIVIIVAMLKIDWVKIAEVAEDRLRVLRGQ
jgi:membrane protein YqaA with SNARE-associated domain